MPRPRVTPWSLANRRIFSGAALAALLLLPVLAGSGLGSAAGARPSPVTASGTASSDVQVTADGHATSGAGSVGSAVELSLDHPVNVTFSYATPSGPGAAAAAAGLSVGVARLQLIVFGVVAGAKEVDLSNVHPATSGSVSVIGDYSYAKYLIEGVYLMHAVLLDPNGTTLFSESFYVKVHATYDLTVITVAFGVLLLYELYTVATLASARSVAKLVRAAEVSREVKPESPP